MNADIAAPEEVLAVLSAIMQGTFLDAAGHAPRVAERCRAAELLARHYGLFVPAERETTQARRDAAERISRAVDAWLAGEEVDSPSTGTPSAG